MTTKNESRPLHCGKKMQRLYIRKGTKNRKWITVGYYCNVCRKMLRDSELILHRRSEGIMKRPELIDSVSNQQIIVLDLGERLTKVGFAREKEPRLILDSNVYFDEDGNAFIQKSDYVESKKTISEQKSFFNSHNEPQIEQDALILFLTLVFEELEINPQDKSVMIIEKNYKNNYGEYLYGRRDEINNSTLPEGIRESLKKKTKIEYINYDKYINFPRKEIALILFDHFEIARIYFSNGELLSLYANNMITGLVVNIGANSTRILPIFEGFIVTHAINVREIGTNQVLDKIRDHFDIYNNYKNSSSHTKYLISKRLRLASEEYCYCSLDPLSDHKNWVENEKMKKHVLLFNDKIALFDQIRYQATELLFEKEELSTSKRKGTLVDAVIESIQRCNIDLSKGFYGNILLTGGGSFYGGIKERFQREFREKVPEHIETNVHSKSNRLISSWIGGSILSILPMFEKRNLWVTRAEYEEKGSSAVNRCI